MSGCCSLIKAKKTFKLNYKAITLVPKPPGIGQKGTDIDL